MQIMKIMQFISKVFRNSRWWWLRHGNCDGSWCCGIDNSWSASSIDVVLRVKDVNTSLVECEMSTYIQIMCNMHYMQTIHSVKNMQTMSMVYYPYIPIDPRFISCTFALSCIFINSLVEAPGERIRCKKCKACKRCYLWSRLYYWA